MKRIRLPRRFRLFNKIFLALALFVSFPAILNAQSAEPVKSATPVVDPAKSTEALQTRIGRARALIAAHRLDIAARELETVRAATQDQSLRNITSIMLMSVYLEDGNYARAEALLEETFRARTKEKDESLGTYFALSGQAINGARLHMTRYRSFGVSMNDASLPPEVTNDLARLRSLLERMIAQAKEISTTRKAYDSLSLLEDVLGIRLSLATDSEDQEKWAGEYASAREALASSQTQIASLGGIPPLRPAQSTGKISSPSPYSSKKTSESPLDIKVPDKTTTPASKTASITANGAELPIREAGLLNSLAIKRVLPQYPNYAKQNGITGRVRVHVLVDETGRVVSISRSEGPKLLRASAENAARQWSFQIAPVDARPTRVSGYIDFSFTL